MSLVVVCVIVALAAIWYYDADGAKPGHPRPAGTRSRPIPGRRTSSRARTGTSTSSSTSCGSSSGRRRSFIATVGIPTICLILLIGLPFYDRRRERRPLRRPVAMVAAVLSIALDGRAHLEGRDREGGARLRARRARPEWAEEQGFAGNEEADAGRELFAQSGCLNCHTYLGAGREPRRARSLRRSGRRTTPRTSSQYLDEPGGVRQHRDGLVLVPRARRTSRRSARSSRPRRADAGASGVGYARCRQALAS